MIRIAQWPRWQGRAIYEVVRKRKDRRRKLSLSFIALTADWDDRFMSFARLLGSREQPVADSYLVRVLQYAARHGAETGRIHVERRRFGAMVLSTRFADVGSKLGARVYDALLESGIAVPDAENPAPPSAPDGRGTFRGGSAEPSAEDGAPDLRQDLDLEVGSKESPPSPPRPDSAATAGRDQASPEEAAHGGNGRRPSVAEALAGKAEALVDVVRQRLGDPGGWAVSFATWAKHCTAAAADGVTPEDLRQALRRNPNGKPWEVLDPLRGDAARRNADRRSRDKAREDAARSLEEEVQAVLAMDPERRTEYLDERRRGLRYNDPQAKERLERLEARVVAPQPEGEGPDF